MSNIQGTPIFKMSGAGNDFVVLDGRGVDVSEFRKTERIREVCAEFRTDGLMILDVSDSADFRMEFFNPDGSGGMMCGNGGRCIVAFADWLGIKPADGHTYSFLAPDGIHLAEILARPSGGRRLPPEGLSTPGKFTPKIGRFSGTPCSPQGEGPIADGRGRSERNAGPPQISDLWGARSERSSDSGSTVYRQAKLIYIVPDFCNPSGETMTLEERQALVEFARREDLLIVEDSPYRELRYSGEPLPTVYSLAPERTLHLGSFSKIFAPGFRLGWIIGAPELLEQIFVCKQALDLCPPVFDQYLATEFLGSGALDRNLVRSISLYREKRDYMLELLEKYMPDGVTWTHPDGGLFLWVTLPEEVDTVAMYDSALKAGVAYVAGSFFYLDGSHRNTMRLNFSYLARERMVAGVKLLAAEIQKARSQQRAGF